MHIRVLELTRSNRFTLSDIKDIVYAPEAKVQVILGSNGSGKSSLLGMLLPNTHNIKHIFGDTGGSRLTIDHDNGEYVISTGIFSNTKKHSFIFNGEELNISGVRSIQQDLIYEHFGLDAMSSSIILGTTRLTTMSGQDRKKVFSKISTIDHTYPMNVYNKLKQRLRDVQGAIKLNNEYRISICETALTPEQLEEHVLNISSLKRLIEQLLVEYNPSVNKDVDIDNLIATVEQKLKVATSKLEKIHSGVTIEGITREINTHTTELIGTKARLATLLSEHDKYASLDVNGSDTIDSRLSLLHDELSTYESENEYDIQIDDVNDIHNNVSITFPAIREILTELMSVTRHDETYMLTPDNSDAIAAISNKITTLEGELRQEQHKLAHMTSLRNDDNKIVCTGCGTEMYNKHDPIEENRLVIAIAKLNTAISDAKMELSKLATLQEQFVNEQQLFSGWFNIIRNNSLPSVSKLWRKITGIDSSEKDLLVTIIPSILTKMSSVYNFVIKWKHIGKTKFEHEELLKLQPSMGGNISIATLIGEISTNISTLTYKKVGLENTISNLNTDMQKLTSFINAYTDLDNAVGDIGKGKLLIADSIKAKNIFTLINELKNYLIELEQAVSANKQREFLIQSIDKETKQLTSTEEALQVLVKGLSPTEGLIAKSLNGFINVFLKDMSDLINSIWSYNVELLPFDIEENELDYRFAVCINNGSVREDVSMLSSSLQEIVDLAFKITYMKFAKLQDMPLVLDEFGRTFDAAHRLKAYNIIATKFADMFSQLFIVSHYHELYSVFPHADTIVINDKNIDMSGIREWNKVISFTHI